MSGINQTLDGGKDYTMNKPLKITLPERPNLSLIPNAVRQCLEKKINPEEVISEKHQKDFKKDDENVEDENNEN